MSKSLLEVREYKFQRCTITVRLDRRQKTLSFVEWSDSHLDYIAKEWVFAGRKLEYMNGWLHILEAMQYIINDCKKVMESWEKEETDNIVKLLVALGEDDESDKEEK